MKHDDISGADRDDDVSGSIESMDDFWQRPLPSQLDTRLVDLLPTICASQKDELSALADLRFVLGEEPFAKFFSVDGECTVPDMVVHSGVLDRIRSPNPLEQLLRKGEHPIDRRTHPRAPRHSELVAGRARTTHRPQSTHRTGIVA
jgi:hypothetical protein